MAVPPNLPTLLEILEFTECADYFGDWHGARAIDQCVAATRTSRARPRCRISPSRRHDSWTLFTELQVMEMHADLHGFYAKVGEFLAAACCTRFHARIVAVRFNKWKAEAGAGAGQRAPPSPRMSIGGYYSDVESDNEYEDALSEPGSLDVDVLAQGLGGLGLDNDKKTPVKISVSALPDTPPDSTDRESRSCAPDPVPVDYYSYNTPPDSSLFDRTWRETRSLAPEPVPFRLSTSADLSNRQRASTPEPFPEYNDDDDGKVTRLTPPDRASKPKSKSRRVSDVDGTYLMMPDVGKLMRRDVKSEMDASSFIRQLQQEFGANDAKEGIVYVLRHHADRQLHKVGFTASTAAVRLSQTGCWGRNNVDIVYEGPGAAFVGAYRAEKLAQEMLRAKNWIIVDCAKCDSTHDEWFLADTAEVVDVVRCMEGLVRRPAYTRHWRTGKWTLDQDAVNEHAAQFAGRLPNRFLQQAATTHGVGSRMPGPAVDHGRTGLGWGGWGAQYMYQHEGSSFL